MSIWIDVVGIGEDGYAGLAPAARRALQSADVIIGGDRHHGLAPDLPAERSQAPSKRRRTRRRASTPAEWRR